MTCSVLEFAGAFLISMLGLVIIWPFLIQPILDAIIETRKYNKIDKAFSKFKKELTKARNK